MSRAIIIAVAILLALLGVTAYIRSYWAGPTHATSSLTSRQASDTNGLPEPASETLKDPSAQQEPAPPPPPPPPPPPSPPADESIVQSSSEPKRTLAGVTHDDLKKIEHYLPPGAHIYTYPVSESTLAPALISADLDGDGKADTIVVYNERKPTTEEGSLPLTLSVLVRDGSDLTVHSSVRLIGGVLSNAPIVGLGAPLALRDVTGDGRPEIIVVSGTGASIGFALQVYSLEGSSLHELGNMDGHFFRVRSGGQGKPSIITVRSRYERQARLYQWNGKTFEEADKRQLKPNN